METLVSRVKGIMLEPRATWKEIDGEFTKGGDVWGKYIAPLAAIGPLASMIGMRPLQGQKRIVAGCDVPR